MNNNKLDLSSLQRVIDLGYYIDKIKRVLSDDTCSPIRYIAFDDSIDKMFYTLLPSLSFDAKILELGCSCGRNLDYLFKKGYRNLYGVECKRTAILLGREVFADLHRNATIIIGDAEKIVRNFNDDFFDLVFIHGFLQFIINQSILDEMMRICKTFILFMESKMSINDKYLLDQAEQYFLDNNFYKIAQEDFIYNHHTQLVFPIHASSYDRSMTCRRVFLKKDKELGG